MDERLKEEGNAWVTSTRSNILSLPSGSVKTFALSTVNNIDKRLQRAHLLDDGEALDSIQLEMLKLMKYLVQVENEPPEKA